MQQLKLKPDIHKFDTCKDFAREFALGQGDVILTNQFIYEPFFSSEVSDATVIFQESYGQGEPSDAMVEAILADMPKTFARVVGIGGGTVIDIAKILAVKDNSPVDKLYDNPAALCREKQLVLVPTTCGTGSEVTNISVLALESKGTKMGLTADALYADSAVLVPELLKGLPYRFFAASAIDALVHAFESCLTPKTTVYSEMYAHGAIEMLLAGFAAIEKDGPEARHALLEDFLIASNYAGIAFGNAGVGAVHAMSYPLGTTYHVPHGEANYEVFVEIFVRYTRLAPQGKIKGFNALLAGLLGCAEGEVYTRLQSLLEAVMPRKPLREYGVTAQDLNDFTENVLTKQTRLLPNFYVPFSAEEVRDIYQTLY